MKHYGRRRPSLHRLGNDLMLLVTCRNLLYREAGRMAARTLKKHRPDELTEVQASASGHGSRIVNATLSRMLPNLRSASPLGKKFAACLKAA